jgi:membrane-bound lytic murein transglycosylase B
MARVVPGATGDLLARSLAAVLAGTAVALAPAHAPANSAGAVEPVLPAPGAGYSQHPRAAELLLKLRLEHGFSESDIAGVQAALRDAQQIPKLIEAEQQAKEKTLTWDAYRRIHVHESNIRNGARFMREHHAWLARAEAAYGVPPAVIAAIMGVETKFGAYTGPHRVLDSLTTQGFDHPTRTPFFFSELVEFFVLCREQGLRPGDVRGSYAGAVGAAQFMPSNYRRLAVDFDGDGHRNLWEPADAIGSIGNYLVNYAPAASWQRGLPLVVPAALAEPPEADWPLNARTVTHVVGDFERAGVRPGTPLPADTPVALLELTLSGEPPGKEYWLALGNFYAVMAYNPRVYYAMAVTQLAEALQQVPAPADAAQR